MNQDPSGVWRAVTHRVIGRAWSHRPRVVVSPVKKLVDGHPSATMTEKSNRLVMGPENVYQLTTFAVGLSTW
jgi:hypothetical protein